MWNSCQSSTALAPWGSIIPQQLYVGLVSHLLEGGEKERGEGECHTQLQNLG